MYYNNLRATGLAYHYLQWDASDSAPIETEEEEGDGEDGKGIL